jgi:hypothetical protein
MAQSEAELGGGPTQLIDSIATPLNRRLCD